MAEPVVPESQKAFYDQFHFAPGVKDGDRLFCSGQIGIGPDGRAPEDPEAQFDLAFQGVAAVLREAGVAFAEIVEMTTYHVGLREHIATFSKVKDRYIEKPYPAWSAIGVSELAFPGALVEIRVIARLPA